MLCTMHNLFLPRQFRCSAARFGGKFAPSQKSRDYMWGHCSVKCRSQENPTWRSAPSSEQRPHYEWGRAKAWGRWGWSPPPMSNLFREWSSNLHIKKSISLHLESWCRHHAGNAWEGRIRGPPTTSRALFDAHFYTTTTIGLRKRFRVNHRKHHYYYSDKVHPLIHAMNIYFASCSALGRQQLWYPIFDTAVVGC